MANPELNQLSPELVAFYQQCLQTLSQSDIPFLIGGGYAFRAHTEIVRDTNDIDIFCKPGDYPKVLKLFEDQGHSSVIQDARWVAKTKKDAFHLDIIFSSVNGLCTVDDFWFERKVPGELFGVAINYVGPEEQLWCKAYMCDRYRYDGGDMNHLILKCGETLDWKWLLHRMEADWLLLFSHLVMFNFVYPSRRKVIPLWLMQELVNRFSNHMSLPTPKDDVCRGPLISQSQYEIDITHWGFKVVTYGTI